MVKENIYLQTLSDLLAERGMSKKDLSDRAGLSESMLSTIYRRNSIPRIKTLIRICNALGIKLSEFFERVESVIIEK